MEEYLDQLLCYLPIRFSDEEVNHFIKYLSEAYIENIEKEKYQFAYTAFHMLSMVFIYKIKWLLKKQNNSDIINSLNNQIKKRGVVFNTFFDLSRVPEKISFEVLLKALRFHANDIGICINHVSARDNCSHASGRIYYKTPERIEPYIEEKIEFVQKIQKKISSEIHDILLEYLEKNWAPPIQFGYIRNWIISNYFSHEDLQLISTLNLSLLKKKSNNEKVIYQKILYLSLLFEIQTQNNVGKNLFLEKLPVFMDGLSKTIIIKKGDNEITISVNEIIEKYLLPIINNFSEGEKSKAKKILRYKEGEQKKHVWYAGYGSNLSRERFECYIIKDGRPRYALETCKVSKGCSDNTIPSEDDTHQFIIKHKLYFAHPGGKETTNKWGKGGVAFIELDEEKNSDNFTRSRIWKITEEQFKGIWKQEGETWYDKPITLGEKDGMPVKTITHSSKIERVRKPSKRYLKTIIEGLKETYDMTDDEIVSYLIKKEGIENNYKKNELLGIMVET